jgi:hypothetical protein
MTSILITGTSRTYEMPVRIRSLCVPARSPSLACGILHQTWRRLLCYPLAFRLSARNSVAHSALKRHTVDLFHRLPSSPSI